MNTLFYQMALPCIKMKNNARTLWKEGRNVIISCSKNEQLFSLTVES